MYDFDTVLKFAKRYAGLGSAVQEQLDDILRGDDSGLNSNAVKFIKDQLGGLTAELDAALEAVGPSA